MTVRPSERSTRDWALAYASFGWRCFPVVPSSKKPMYKGWQRDATTDPDQIARYWRHEPGPNIGIVTGEAFIAFDIEADHLPALSAWMRMHGHLLPATPMARTGRGGIHALTAPFGDGGRALRLDGVRIGELKGRGGFIVACPSTTIGSYSWIRSPVDISLGHAPDWLRSLVPSPPKAAHADRIVVGRSHGEASLAALARTVRDATEGSRNDILYWAMRRALDDGVPTAIAGSVLGRMAAAAGLEEREIAATIRSAAEAGT